MDTWQGLHSCIAMNKAKCLAGEVIPLSIVEWPLDSSTNNRTRLSAASDVIYLKPFILIIKLMIFALGLYIHTVVLEAHAQTNYVYFLNL